MSTAAKRSRERPLILVADDFTDALELYQEFLGLEGYDVVVAANGEEALRLARELDPDFILMDLSMPIMDGYAAAEALRLDEQTRDIPILALTGHVMAKHTARARDAGCDTVVSKPCMPADLSAKIRSMLHVSKPKA